MGRVVFLLEDPSMKEFLLEYLPRLIPGWEHGQHFLLIEYHGKSDLDGNIRTKLKKWTEPGVCFVIVRDTDGADCLALKETLRGRCDGLGREALIRLICQELEAWYLGDSAALQSAYPQAKKAILSLAKRHPDPDVCRKPSRELKQFIPEFQKRDAARRLGRLLHYRNNRSASLRVFSQGVERLAHQEE